MDENILDVNQSVESSLSSHQELVEVSKGYGTDTFVDSSDIDNRGFVDSVSQGDANAPTVNGYNALSLMDEDLGAIPVYVINEDTRASVPSSGGGYQMSTYYVDYFSGILANMNPTDYVCYYTRRYSSNYNYDDIYRLIYDVEVVNDQAQQGSYPCIEITRYNGQSDYQVNEYTYSLTSIPSFSYASFGHYSDLRKEGSYDFSVTLLFFLGFFAVYHVCHDLFDYVMEHVYKR